MRVVGGYCDEEAICKHCASRKGEKTCCEYIPGECLPTDFMGTRGKLDTKKMTDALKSGRYQIDWWEGSPPGFSGMFYGPYIRPSIKGTEGRLANPARGGSSPCTFLSTNGCELPFKDRPFICRAVEAKEDECELHAGSGHSKRVAARSWAMYHDELIAVEEEVEEWNISAK